MYCVSNDLPLPERVPSVLETRPVFCLLSCSVPGAQHGVRGVTGARLSGLLIAGMPGLVQRVHEEACTA